MTALMLGGEMPHWSDPHPVGGAVLRELLATVHGDTLVVGPHDPSLIAAIPARQVTVLVRGVPDAARYAGLPGVQVCCGSLEKLAAVPAYDTVVALDGLARAGSTEGADLTWSAGIAQLLTVLRPGGRLLLGLENPAGLHRLYAGAAAPGDGDWVVAADDTVPAGLGALRERLRTAGLAVLRDYAAYPSPRSPVTLLSEAALTEPDLHGALTSVLRRAGTPDGPLLADPRPLAAALLRQGLGAALAPAWIVVAARPGHHPAPLPEGFADGTRLERTAAGWSWSAGPVPVGRCLHDALVAAAHAGDQPELRTLLATWRSGDAAAVPADAIVLSADGTLHPLTGPGPESPLAGLTAELGDSAELVAALSGGSVTAPTPRTLREITAAHDRLAQQVSDLRDQLVWYEKRTATLQTELSRAHRIISVLKGTAAGKAAKAVLSGARSGRRLARAAIRRLRH